MPAATGQPDGPLGRALLCALRAHRPSPARDRAAKDRDATARSLVCQALDGLHGLLAPWSEDAERVVARARTVLGALGPGEESEDTRFVWGGEELAEVRPRRSIWRNPLERHAPLARA